ncbi:MAG TPA: CCA tRNA nucleotidyltransferase [Candidatus Kapabacteria bacterium]|nr:CCA tRNA nucleotidyltransferase [Candidatus Kapabacteria bacterium]HYM35307.1 CCA tRNA nucleotidyltransferase [Steroidobacteraceae bacterium]
MKKQKLHITEPLLVAVGQIADAAGVSAYVVGGFVRDVLLGRGNDRDIDITVIGDGVSFAKRVASEFEGAHVVVYEKFRTAMVEIGDVKLEFVGARKESYRSASRNPVTEEGTLEDDLARRDFTVNALAASLNSLAFGEIVDLYDGLNDLDSKILRTPLAPEATFEDDPLRMMRAARFAAQLEFDIVPEALDAMHAMRERTKIVSQERITDEFMKIMASPRPSIGIVVLYETGLLDLVFPEIAKLSGVDLMTVGVQEYAHKDVFKHTMRVLDNAAEMTENVWLRFAALLHDVAKPKTKSFRDSYGWTFYGHDIIGARWVEKIFRRMKLPIDAAKYVQKLVRLHMRPMALVDEGVTDSAVRRVLFEAGNDIEDLMTLCRADITSKNPKLSRKYQGNYDLVWSKMQEVEEKDKMRSFQSPVRGEEIMQIAGLPPSKTVGLIKDAIENAILDGIIPNDHEAAKEYMLKIKDEIVAANPLTEREKARTEPK